MTDDEIDAMLAAWGRWMRDQMDALGYPSRSVEGRMIDDGGMLPAGTQNRVPLTYMPEHVAAVELAVTAVMALSRGELYRLVLLQEYVHPYSTQRINAQSMRLPLRRYKELLSRAKELVAVNLCITA